MAKMNNYKRYISEISVLDLPWEQFQGCNILVTGATGLIGSCIVDLLMQKQGLGFHVFALVRNLNNAKTRFSEYIESGKLFFINHDITLPLNENIDFHFIIHAASYGNPGAFDSIPVDVMKSNFLGVMNLLDYGKIHNLKRFLYISSGEVYGEGNGANFVESFSGYVDPLIARSCYPSSKRASETLCVSYAKQYNLDVVIARPCHIYGPCFTATDNRVYAQFIRNVINGDNIILKSTGTQYRSWCYVVDCVSALFYILLRGNRCEAYNIADKESCVTIRKLAEMIAEVSGREVVMTESTFSEKQSFNPVKRSIFSTCKLEQLGWNTIGNFRDKLSSVIEDCRVSI